MFRIGDFARLAQVSTRTLRLYDQLDLLKPAIVAPQTNYRYYTIDQFPRLIRILALKDLGFSLEQIAQMLETELSADQLRGMLQLKQAELERQASAVQARLTLVEARLKQIELEVIMPTYEVVLKKIQPHAHDPNCLLCRDLKEMGGLPKSTDDVLRHIPESPSDKFSIPIEAPDPLPAGEPPSPLFFVRSGPPASRPPFTQDDEMAVMPFVETHTLPGVEMAATVIHTGSRDTLPQACRALVDWIERNHYRVAGHYQETKLGEGEPPMFELLIPVLPEANTAT